MVCVFYHPFPVQAGGATGSRVRPFRMREAFEDIGYEVLDVTGHSSQRARRMSAVVRDLRRGREIDFLYGESHTMPPALTDPHHLPTRPLLDPGFLAQVRRHGLATGIFYRDIYWRFGDVAPDWPWYKRLVVKPFYRLEWTAYRRYVDHLFLPSRLMAEALPSPWEPERLSALPPGIDSLAGVATRPERETLDLNLLYVGGVAPPLYDLTPLFESLRGVPAAHLTLSCRADEWQRWRAHYDVPSNVEVVHRSGDELAQLYARADLAAVVREPHEYLDFAMPVKVFEALAYGVPLIASPGTEIARFVEREDLGWVIQDPAGFRALAAELMAHPERLDRARERVASARERHTWTARARQVAETLGATVA